jgi:hypothetical protein
LPTDTVHENSGTITRAGGTTSVTVSLAGTDSTTAGNVAVVFITSQVNLAAPAGWSADKSINNTLWAYTSPELTAGETSWNFTYTSAGSIAFSWYVAELSGIDPAVPLEVTASAGANIGDGGTASTGTTPQSAALDVVVFAVFEVQQAAGTETQSWDSYTNGFEELVDIAPGFAGAWQLAVARKSVSGQTGQFSSTATLATTASSSLVNAMVVSYLAANSPIVAPLAHFLGFEWGTIGGANSATGVTNMMGAALTNTTGTWNTNYLIQAASDRASGYGLRVARSAVAAYVRAGNLAVKSASFGFNVRVVSATGTVVVAEVANDLGSVVRAQLLYDSATSQFGVRCGTTGTTSWQSGTTATNTWVWVDLRVKCTTTTWRAEWRLETGAGVYTDQAAAELTGQSAGNTFHVLHLGSATAHTVTADFDDVCLSAFYAAYPLGPHEVRLLTVDPAGTPTLSGTSSNFNVFTANTTLAAWNATNARNAVDEVPPTISASADGVCQVNLAASDYIEFPMQNPTLAADEIISGVRELAAMWGGTGTGTGTVGIRSWDGTTETTLIAASVSYDPGSPTAVSSTEPYWQCAMWPMPNGWTAAKLAAAALRFGFSTDATPDMGAHVLYLEYATRKATTTTVVGEAGGVTLESNVNPNTTGVRSLVTTTPSDQGTTLNWTDAGGPHTQSVAAASTDTQTLDAEAGEVTFIEVVSENEDPDRE